MAGAEASIHYPDLGATVFPASIPEGAADELPGLYDSLFSTVDWFIADDHTSGSGACVLQRPRHILLFDVRGDTVEVLNKVFAIAPHDVTRACRALFRALPQTRRVHIEVMFPPTELRLPKRVLYSTDHMVIDLPDTVAEYTASLGKRTRRHLRTSDKRLRADHPSLNRVCVDTGPTTRRLIRTLIAWKIRRFEGLGRSTVWESEPRAAEDFATLASRSGRALVTSVDGDAMAINFFFPVGHAVFAVQSAFDPRYEPYSLGMLCAYEVVCEAIREGARQLSLLWGDTGYKSHLGARPVTATRISVFDSHLGRLFSPREAVWVARHRARRLTMYYWKTRHAVGSLRTGRPSRLTRLASAPWRR